MTLALRPRCFYCDNLVKPEDALLTRTGKVYGPCCEDVGARERVEVLGFTGSQYDPTDKQYEWLYRQLEENAKRLRHGACIGSDERAHHAALKIGVPITVHPPVNKNKMMALEAHPLVTVLPGDTYMNRNHTIVAGCDRLLALPNCRERVRSGTWSTVRYAVKNHTPVAICYGDGEVEER